MKYVRFKSRDCVLSHDLQVTLFPSRRAYLRYHRTKTHGGVQGTGKGTAAVMFGYDAEAVKDGDPVAELVFYAEQFTPENIAHEITHGLFHLFREAGRANFSEKPPRMATEDEEVFATLHGIYVKEILEWREEIKGN